MKAVLIEESRPARSRHAVVFCCDNAYLPFAVLATSTLTRANPLRDFDICFVSQDRLDLPPVLADTDVRVCRVDASSVFADLPTSDRFSVAAYLRIVLPEVFAADYDRILYMDCDTMVVGGALSDVFALDLHGAPVGAVPDSWKWKKPSRPTPDQAGLGINGPYFNSGVLLMDSKRFLDQEIRQKCLAAFHEYGADRVYFDQTILNVALRDNWARLGPVWNWQWAVVRPMFEIYLDLQIVHFITPNKPWNDPKGKMPAIYRERARRFLTAHFPDLPVTVPAPPDRLRKRDIFINLLKHIARVPAIVRVYGENGGDIHRTLPPHGGPDG